MDETLVEERREAPSSGMVKALQAAKAQAATLSKQGHFDEALDRRNDAVGFTKSIYGENSKEYVVALYECGMALFDKGCYDEALDTLQTSLNVYYDNRLNVPEKLGDVLLGLGLCCFATQCYDDALNFYQDCIHVLESYFGKNHHGLVTPWINIGLVEFERQDYDKATKAYQRAQKLNSTQTDRLLNAEIYHNLGVIHDRQGHLVEALGMYRMSARIREQLLGPTHGNTTLTLYNIAQVLRDQGKMKESAEVHEKVLAAREHHFGVFHLETAESYQALGLLNVALGKKKSGGRMLNKALDIRKSVLGPSGEGLVADTASLIASVVA